MYHKRLSTPLIVLATLLLAAMACSVGQTPKSEPTAVPAASEATPTEVKVEPTPTVTQPAAAESPLPSPTVAEEEPAAEEPADEPQPSAGSREGILALAKGEYWPQEVVLVTVTAGQPLPDGAWVGVVPADAPHGVAAEADDVDVDYEYVEGMQTGTAELTAPNTPGNYEVRLLDPNAELGKQELDGVAFAVVAHDLSGVSLELDKGSYTPGEEIQVAYSAPDTLPQDAWIGLVPAPIAHGSSEEADSYDLDYEYLSAVEEGMVSLTAPSEPGEYDVRMFDSAVSDGREIASVTFTVVAHDAAQASLRLNKNVLAPGDEFEVTFTAPATLPEDAWVGIIPSEVAHGSEEEADGYDVDYQYLGGQASGTMTFYAPEETGKYDMRMFDTDSSGTELASMSFEVR